MILLHISDIFKHEKKIKNFQASLSERTKSYKWYFLTVIFFLQETSRALNKSDLEVLIEI